LEEVNDLVFLLDNNEIKDSIDEARQNIGNPTASISNTSNTIDTNIDIIQNDKNTEEIYSCSNENLKSDHNNLTKNNYSLFFENNDMSSSSESENESNFFDDGILHKISSWAVKNRITNVALSELLKLLRNNHKCFNSFPIDARSILKINTNRSLEVRAMHPGIYHHFGLANGIKNVIGSQIVLDDTIRLLIGIDGLPLANSSDSQFWPILCSIQNDSNFNTQVFLVGLYWGKQKPQNSNEFLVELVNELKQLYIDGIYLPGGKKKVIVHAFCCDVPAKFIFSVQKDIEDFHLV